MDTFAEQLVKKRSDSSDSMKKTLIIAGAGVIIALLLILSFFVTFLALFFAAAAGYAAYYLLSGLNIEYEYAVTNGTLDIDKIIAKRKRINMISVNVKDFTSFDYYLSVDDKFDGTEIHSMGVDHSSGVEEEPFYADFQNESYGNVRLVFSPNEKVLGCIRPYLSGNIRNKF